MTPTPVLGVPIQERYLAIDVLRGLTIALMIVVNTPGSWSHLYAPFAHADWHGFTITDLVFPTFLFVVGNAMSFSMKKMEKMDQGVFLKKVFKRTAIIFLIGWGLNAFPFFEYNEAGGIVMINWWDVRLLGVLQRIALCYMLASLILFYLGKRGAVVFSILTLLGFWWALYFFGDTEDPYSLTGNAVLKLDLWLIGAKNLYGGEGIPFEPEGILSTFPSVVNVIGGYFAGKFIQQMGNTSKTVKAIFIAGVVMIVVCLLWDNVFPINKKIWTSPYVLLTVGLDLFLIAFLILVIEVWKKRNWTYPFEVFGRNPLILYVLSGIVISVMHIIQIGDKSLKGVIYELAFTSWLGPKNASLLFALFYMLLIWLVGLWMDRKKIYIKV
ncbi:Predicted acyltransferase [Aquiflexum balticum DSM 16537]|uniref:Predicted acyltransferase n=1 Tax=Aquiflexum balticum DSM 16537 TaxID=758820 RepID=A0A1W2H6S5_9BACT|nr:heparan-alpha-glucosaminide N-acetyltransferase domain-containing protein [Aquiflexum balticum]SMD44645.1 Predicted acyltransferase [Aquiflexum balticum DSM 16537]